MTILKTKLTVLEEETIETLLTTTLEQVLPLVEINTKIKTTRATRPPEELIRQTLVVIIIIIIIQELTRQALEATLIHRQDRIAPVQTPAAAVMVGDHPEAEEEEDNLYFKLNKKLNLS